MQAVELAFRRRKTGYSDRENERANMVGDNLDIASDPDDGRDRPADVARGSTGARAYLGVHFRCCDVYTRVYVNRDRSAYAGHCPRCSRPVTVRIGPGGTSSRFFEVG